MYVGTKKFHKSVSVWFNSFLPTAEDIHVYCEHEDSGTCQDYWEKTVQEYKELKGQQNATLAQAKLYYTGDDLGMTTQEVDPNEQQYLPVEKGCHQMCDKTWQQHFKQLVNLHEEHPRLEDSCATQKCLEVEHVTERNYNPTKTIQDILLGN